MTENGGPAEEHKDQIMLIPIHRPTDTQEMIEMLERLMQWLRGEEHSILITLPDNQPYYLMGAGNIDIDFYEGTYLDTNGQVMSLKTSLKVQSKEYMRSIRIFAENDLQVSIAGQNNLTIIGGETVSLTELPFKQVYITASQPTRIRILASTSPHMVDSDSIEPQTVFCERYDADETSAQSVTVDTGVYSRTQVEVFASADANTTFIFESSMDNEHWFQVQAWGATSTVHLGYMNSVRYMRFSSTAGGVPGNKIDLMIVASR